MNFYDNAVSEELFNKIIVDRRLDNSQRWACSPLFWEDAIQTGITGVCASSHVSEEVYHAIIQELSPYFPPHDNLRIQHYIWFKSSGIPLHDDGCHKFGATLYINDVWDMSYGGIFIWQEGDEYKAICPRKNMLAVNTDYRMHMVTAISDLAPEPRYTVQIWGM